MSLTLNRPPEISRRLMGYSISLYHLYSCGSAEVGQVITILVHWGSRYTPSYLHYSYFSCRIKSLKLFRLHFPSWRHQMETFSALLTFCAGNSLVTGEFPTQRPVTRSFDVFFDPRLNKQLNKQSRGWWFETPSRSLWRQRNANGFCQGDLFLRVLYTIGRYWSE